jgi:hypothetical protein
VSRDKLFEFWGVLNAGDDQDDGIAEQQARNAEDGFDEEIGTLSFKVPIYLFFRIVALLKGIDRLKGLLEVIGYFRVVLFDV